MEPMTLLIILIVAGIAVMVGPAMIKAIAGLTKLFVPIGILVIAVAAVMYMTGNLGSGSLNVMGSSDAVLPDNQIVGLTIVDGSGEVNGNKSSDFYNSDFTFMSLRMADADIADGEDLCWNLTARRNANNVEDGAVVEITCSVPDVAIDGITPTNLIERTQSKLDATIGGAYTAKTQTSVMNTASFAAAADKVSVQVCMDHDETYEDGMNAQDAISITCSAGGKSVIVSAVAAD